MVVSIIALFLGSAVAITTADRRSAMISSLCGEGSDFYGPTMGSLGSGDMSSKGSGSPTCFYQNRSRASSVLAALLVLAAVQYTISMLKCNHVYFLWEWSLKVKAAFELPDSAMQAPTSKPKGSPQSKPNKFWVSGDRKHQKKKAGRAHSELQPPESDHVAFPGNTCTFCSLFSCYSPGSTLLITARSQL